MFKKFFSFFSSGCPCDKFKPVDLHDKESIKKCSTQALLAFIRDGNICQTSGNRIATEIFDRLCKE